MSNIEQGRRRGGERRAVWRGQQDVAKARGLGGAKGIAAEFEMWPVEDTWRQQFEGRRCSAMSGTKPPQLGAAREGLAFVEQGAGVLGGADLLQGKALRAVKGAGCYRARGQSGIGYRTEGGAGDQRGHERGNVSKRGECTG